MFRENVTCRIIGGMKEERVALSPKELQRVRIIGLLVDGRISGQEAAEKLGLCGRQIIRLKKKYSGQGDVGLIHGNRGRAPKGRIGDDVRTLVLELYQEKYYDFNFSHFTEYLNEKEGVRISRNSVTRILNEGGIRSKKSVKRRGKLHRSRPRRTAPGMLWQTDATEHEWFGKGNGYATLHAYIDDATGIVVGAYFTKNECLAGYVEALRQGIERYGLPMEIYSDRHTILRSPKAGKEEDDDDDDDKKGQPLSNFGKGLKDLGIGQIFALSPEAKGRIERLWETLQDRWTCELRRLGIKTIKEANKVLPMLLDEHNKKFAVKAQEADVYVPLTNEIDIAFMFAHRSTRKTDNGGAISYKGRSYIPQAADGIEAIARVTVEVRETLDGRIYIIHKKNRIEMQEMVKPQRADKATKEVNAEEDKSVMTREQDEKHPLGCSSMDKRRRKSMSAKGSSGIAAVSTP